MKYTIQVWLFTILSSPLLLTLILGIIINESSLNSIFDSYEMIILMIIFGLILSIPAMAIFWLIVKNLNSDYLIWKKKIILSAYSFISVWITFYLVDNGFITRWTQQTVWVLIYSITIVIGIWIFKIPRNET
jgi:amino acid transporter